MATKADFDTELVDRTQGYLAYFNLSVAVDGTNPFTKGPIGWAFQVIDRTPLTGVYPADSDLALLDSFLYFEMCDLAEYRLLKNIFTKMVQNRVQVGVNSIYYSDLRNSLETRIQELFKELNQRYKLGMPALTGGTINLANEQVATPSDSYWNTGAW